MICLSHSTIQQSTQHYADREHGIMAIEQESPTTWPLTSTGSTADDLQLTVALKMFFF